MSSVLFNYFCSLFIGKKGLALKNYIKSHLSSRELGEKGKILKELEAQYDDNKKKVGEGINTQSGKISTQRAKVKNLNENINKMTSVFFDTLVFGLICIIELSFLIAFFLRLKYCKLKYIKLLNNNKKFD